MSKNNQAGRGGAHDILRQDRRNPLDAVFRPRSVALIGASDKAGSVGAALTVNLASYGGKFFPVNSKHDTISDRRAYASVRDLPEKPELAVIATPAATVPGIVRECAAAGVKAAVVISAGFKETGAAGAALEQEVLAAARRSNIRIIGPNCLGVMSPHLKFNATFAGTIARPGSVAFLSQSGALCTAILDWSLRQNVGFSAFASVGSMLDVGWGDLIDWLADDPLTKSMVIYMESVGDARAFLSAAREVALSKPVIVIKVGHTEAAAHAAASHTGALTGSDAVLDAALRRAGVLRVGTIEELFDMAEALAKQPRPRGPRLAIITNAGGPGALATDMLVSSGAELAELSADTMSGLNACLPAEWSHGNPVDILGDAKPDRFARAIEIVTRDPGADGALVILTPQAMTDPAATAEAVVPLAKSAGKPVIASWMGGASVEAGRRILNEAGIPTYDHPDTAARAFSLMWRHSRSLRALYETPQLTDDIPNAARLRKRASQLIHHARNSGATLLGQRECSEILAAYGIPVVPAQMATSAAEAVKAARSLGHPVVLKLHSGSITHKTEVGGVKLDLRSDHEVKRAWSEIKGAVSAKEFIGVIVEPMVTAADGVELILGSSIDTQFGPVMLFGAGGKFVEVFRDHALGLPPLTATLARRLMERTRIMTALKGVRGHAPVDLAGLEQILVRFSHLIVEQPRIREMDINPLLATPRGMTALDVRILLHPMTTPDDRLPRPVIRPYPAHCAGRCRLKDGTRVDIRPIRPEDEPQLREFHVTLSSRSVYQRYFNELGLDQRIAHERLARMCFIDYDREMALLALRSGTSEILGVGRLGRLHGRDEAEFAVLIADRWQGKGLGLELLRRLVDFGRSEKIARISADILPDNAGMQALARKAGFTVACDSLDGECRAQLDL